MKAGWVSRSVYQKAVEENKKLKAQIKILVGPTNSLTPQKIDLLNRYRKEFREEKYFNELLKQAAQDYLEEHPEYDIKNPEFSLEKINKIEKKAFIRLTGEEVQSGLNRQRHAEGLILQLPKDHDGRNTWLLNYGVSEEAWSLRDNHINKPKWVEATESAETIGG